MSTEVNQNASSTSKMIHTIEKKTQPLQAFITKCVNDWVLNLAGVIAYNMLMAMVPIATIFLAILGLILQSSNIQTYILQQITALFPGLANQENALKLAAFQLQKSSGILGILGILLAILFGSILFVVIEGCLDIIYRVRPRPIIRQFVVAAGMLVIFLILIPIMIFVSAGPAILFSSLNTLPFLKSIPGSSFVLLNIGSILSGFIASFILFEFIYLVVPNQRMSWRNSWCGAVLAAIGTEIFLIVFPFVITHFFNSYAGTIGFAFILLLFFFVFSVLLLLGAEVNAFFFEKIGPVPNDIVTFLSTMVGRLNKDLSSGESPHHQDSRLTERADDTHIAEISNKEGDARGTAP